MIKPPEQHPNAALYCDLMETIKLRTGVVSQTLQLHLNKQCYLPGFAAAEFCILQLRMECELLALGCVAVHTDVPQTRRIQKHWNADRIMSEFDSLKPEYFPQAETEVVDRERKTIKAEIKKGVIKLSEFLRMYHHLAEQLHAGDFLTAKARNKKPYDFNELVKFQNDLINLLNCHTYSLYGGEKHVRVIMNNRLDGRVWWNEGDAMKTM